MPQAAVRPDLLQPLDVHRDLAPKIALDIVTAVDDVAQAAYLLVGEVTHARVGIHVCLGEDLLARGQADPEDVFHVLRHLAGNDPDLRVTQGEHAGDDKFSLP